MKTEFLVGRDSVEAKIDLSIGRDSVEPDIPSSSGPWSLALPRRTK